MPLQENTIYMVKQKILNKKQVQTALIPINEPNCSDFLSYCTCDPNPSNIGACDPTCDPNPSNIDLVP